jgi:gliding motility-associated-like protein
MKLKLILICTYLFCTVINAKAQIPSTWVVNANAFNYNMTITSKANVACVELANANNAIAAFVGGQCRGVVTTNVTVGSAMLGLMVINSNVVSGEKVNFKIYNSVNNTVYDVLDSLVFANGTQVGGLSTPLVLYTNHAPVGIALNTTTINENKAVATLVGLLSATDADAGTTFTYTLAPNLLDNNMFQVNANQLQSAVKFNYELDSTNTVEVTVNDGGGCSYAKQFTIKIINVNDTPTVLKYAATPVSDGQQAGSFMGKFNTVDEDFNQTHNYTLVAGIGSVDNAKFYISNDTLYNVDSIYYPSQSVYKFRVRSTDAGALFVEDTFSIHVINVNHAPKNLFLSKNTVTENMPVGTVIATLTSFDPDVLDTHTYAVTNGVGGTDNTKVKIVGNTLQTTVGYDFETQDTLYIRLKTIDNSLATYSKAFIIIVKDTNDAPTNITLAKDSIEEGNVIGALVGVLNTADQDVANTHTYALVAGLGDVDNAKFTITANSITANQSFNYMHQTYSIRVRTTDNAGAGFEKIIVIKITDKDYAPVANVDAVNVLEDTPTILNVVANDTDKDNNIKPTTVTITLQPKHGTVMVDSLGIVKYTSALNYNGNDTLVYSVCDSTKIIPLCDTALVIIKVLNVADAPVAKWDAVSVTEDTPQAINVLANDTDVENDINAASITITLQPKHGTVAVNTNGTLAYTPTQYYNGADTLIYSLCDNTNPSPLCDTALLIINIIGNPNAPYAINLDTLTYNEDNAVNTTVASATSMDYDVNDTFIYTLVKGDGDVDNKEFKFENNNLVALYKANYDVKPNYAIRVRSTDSFGLYFEKQFTLIIKDINPNDIKLPSTNYVSPNDDGKNDYWLVDDVHIYADFALQIMDQFGQVVYSVDGNYNNEFDGKFGGKALPTGNYYYVFKNASKTFKGNITIGN